MKELNSFQAFSEKVADIVKDDGLNVIFNNAGMSPKYTRLGLVKAEHIIETYAVNTLGPIMLTKVSNRNNKITYSCHLFCI